MITPKIKQVSDPKGCSFPSYNTPHCLPLQMGCNYVLFVYLPFLFLCLPLPLHLKSVQGNMPISWHRYFMLPVSGFQKKQDQDSFVFFCNCVEEGLRGNVVGHLRNFRCWPVNSVRQIYFVRHPSRCSQNTHGEWEEYCTSDVLS